MTPLQACRPSLYLADSPRACCPRPLPFKMSLSWEEPLQLLGVSPASLLYLWREPCLTPQSPLALLASWWLLEASGSCWRVQSEVPVKVWLQRGVSASRDPRSWRMKTKTPATVATQVSPLTIFSLKGFVSKKIQQPRRVAWTSGSAAQGMDQLRQDLRTVSSQTYQARISMASPWRRSLSCKKRKQKEVLQELLASPLSSPTTS